MPKGIVKCGNCKGLEYPVAIHISKTKQIMLSSSSGGYTMDNTLYLDKENKIRLQYYYEGIPRTFATSMTFNAIHHRYLDGEWHALWLEGEKLIYWPTTTYKVEIEIDSTSGWTFDSTQGFIRKND